MKSFFALVTGFVNAIAAGVFTTALTIFSFLFSCIIVFSLLLLFQSRESE